jgi:hypothetical protein
MAKLQEGTAARLKVRAGEREIQVFDARRIFANTTLVHNSVS